MNRIILQLIAFGCFFAGVQALMCYKCSLGIGTLCITTKTTCSSGEQCFNGVGKAGKVVDIMTKGCLSVDKCNMTEPTTFNNQTVYTLTKTCCNTDLCNAAPGLPGTSALGLALATITALFVVNVLV
ncbi:sperm acrosome membrane-associated protein 4 isoform X2 [Etheostoma cragini]|uniref:sperm acrosome membrane-associated protein 4 isoform X2 n=1 Tax=Etheostoma cragini TaxID=417921 RepID=UPI00155E4E81|nr:sperm acrosome membrane-associated protein 4 isoform X2 [Etheostoma cragini]